MAVAASKELDFPFLAGSSLPVTFRLPPLELPLNCDLEDALMIGVGSSDAMDYHALEALQCMVERRKGGESGVRAVQLIEGDEVWPGMRRDRKEVVADPVVGALFYEDPSRPLLGVGEEPTDVSDQSLLRQKLVPS